MYQVNCYSQAVLNWRHTGEVDYFLQDFVNGSYMTTNGADLDDDGDGRRAAVCPR